MYEAIYKLLIPIDSAERAERMIEDTKTAGYISHKKYQNNAVKMPEALSWAPPTS